MFIRCEMDSYDVGKRKKKIIPKDFEIRESLWNGLCEFTEKNDYQKRGQYDWNKDILYLTKNKDLIDFLECEKSSYFDEIDFIDDVKKQVYNSNIKIEKIFILNTFQRVVKKIESDSAYFSRNDGNGLYRVDISDKVKSENLQVGDKVEISVLANKKWLVTNLIRENENDVEIDLSDLLGGY